MMKKHLLEAATLILAALLCAIVANSLAGRERKLAVIGSYPNALTVLREPSPKPLPTLSGPVNTQPAPAATATGTTTAAPSILTSTAAPVKATPPVSSPMKPTPVTATTPVPETSPAQPKTDLARFAVHPDQAYVEIGYDDVATLHNGKALFLDARRTSVFDQGHIAGARPISVWESDVDAKVRKLFDEHGDPAEQARPIVIYCSGGDCEDSHMLAQKLWGIQFNNLYVYKDGFPDWQKHGGSIHTGSNP